LQFLQIFDQINAVLVSRRDFSLTSSVHGGSSFAPVTQPTPAERVCSDILTWEHKAHCLLYTVSTGGWRTEGSRYTNTHTHVISAEVWLWECDPTHRPNGEGKLPWPKRRVQTWG